MAVDVWEITALQQRRQDGELLVLVDLAEAATHQRLAVVRRVPGQADAGPNASLVSGVAE